MFERMLSAYGFVGFIAALIMLALTVWGGEIRVGISRRREIRMFTRGLGARRGRRG